VSHQEKVIWSMVYAGGVAPSIKDRAEVRSIYAFLRQALRLVGEDRPYRGASNFEADGYTYTDRREGDLTEFHGSERIEKSGRVVYQLHYSGGSIR
jgi:hypothetical protein